MWRFAVLVIIATIGIALWAATSAQQQTTQPRQAPQGPTMTVNPNVPVPPTYGELQQRNQLLTQRLATAQEQTQSLSQQLTRTREQYVGLQQQNTALRTQVTQMTTVGGSLVRAYCVNQTTSRNTAGVQASCDRYLCEPVSGLCSDRCSVTAHCADGYYCDGTVCVS